MPQTTDERRARWPGGDQEAIAYLKAQGFKLTPQWFWLKPAPGHKLTEREEDAIIYLIEEWDFGGAMSPSEGIEP
jgi:hypothetical protein